MDKTVSDQLLPPTLRTAMDEISRISGSLPSIELKVFIKTFLPALAGEMKPDDVTAWLSVAGNVYREVHVVDNGRVVYTVPPLMNRHGTILNKHGHESISEIAAIAEQKKQVMSRLGVAYLRAGMESKLNAPGIVLDDVVRWNKILSDNGYEPIPLKGNTAEKAVDTDISKVFTDEYDDL